jgi:hypothetical protein
MELPFPAPGPRRNIVSCHYGGHHAGRRPRPQPGGPIRQYLVLRLQQAQGHWYYTQITTMNERRRRHLLAIADTFKVKG